MALLAFLDELVHFGTCFLHAGEEVLELSAMEDIEGSPDEAHDVIVEVDHIAGMPRRLLFKASFEEEASKGEFSKTNKGKSELLYFLDLEKWKS